MQEFITCVGGEFNFYTILSIALYALIFGFLGKNKPPILSTIPGFCASVGLLFTFIVLYDKLKDFDVPEGDIELLKTLVQELSAAFSTSIIGVSGSLITNIFVKLRIDYIENKGYKNKPYLKQHPHELLHEIKSVSENGFQGLQNTLSSEFSKLRGEGESGNLANVYESLSQLTGKTIDRLDNLFDQLHIKLDHTITALGTNALENTRETIASVNTTFTEQTASLLQENLEQLTTFFKEHKSELEKTAQQFSTQSSSIQTGLDTFQQDLVLEMKKVQDTFTNSAVQMGLNFNTEGAAIQNQLAAYLKQLVDQIQTVNTAFSTSTTQMAEDYGAQANDLRAIFIAIKNSLDNLNDEVQGRVKEVLEGNLKTLESSFQRVADLQLTSQATLQDTTKQFAGAVDQYQALAGNQEDILSQLADQLSDFAELRQHMQEMQGGWKEFSDNVQVMETRVADITNTISQLHLIHEYFQANSKQV